MKKSILKIDRPMISRSESIQANKEFETNVEFKKEEKLENELESMINNYFG